MEYQKFIRSKIRRAPNAGFDPVTPLPEGLFPFQRQIVTRCVKLGRAAIFAGCGLGKTAMQLAWADQVARKTGRPVLILCPLAVAPQTVAEGTKFGITVKGIERADQMAPGICATNYQKLLNPERFPPESLADLGGVVLDESSILKNYSGAIKKALCDLFATVPYKLACTATPAPNDHVELGNHSQFLGVMPSNEMLARWFVSEDGADKGRQKGRAYRLKGHGQRDFWDWVASWSVCLDTPSDLGFSDDGFILPELIQQRHYARVDAVSGAGSGELFRCDALSATNLHREARLTAPARARLVADLVRGEPDEPWVIWCNTDYEADALAEALEGVERVAEVRGSMPDHRKESILGQFLTGEVRVLVTKPTVAGFGLNWQHCARTAFVGLSYSYEQMYQAVRRLWRFGQKREVIAHVVAAETEGEIGKIVARKEEQGETMRKEMVAASKRASEVVVPTARKIKPKKHAGNNYTLWHGDCVEVAKKIPSDSVHFSVFSPPFAGLYIYSDAEQDMGNCADDDEFMQHFGYLVPELLRVTVPGRLCAVHCKDLPRYFGRDGIAGLKDFPGQLISLFQSHGWSYHSRVTIWKCPVVERERTNNNGLLHKTVMRDSSQIRQGMADYLIVFRKYPSPEAGLMADAPVIRPQGFERWVGDQADDPRARKQPHPSPYARGQRVEELDATEKSIALWQRYAEPVWWDIDQMDTLNERLGRDAADEKHICPLQLGLIRRAVYLWSLPGETVLSPFAGLGSEGVVALEEGRKFLGIELKEAYLKRALTNLGSVQPKLFAEV